MPANPGRFSSGPGNEGLGSHPSNGNGMLLGNRPAAQNAAPMGGRTANATPAFTGGRPAPATGGGSLGNRQGIAPLNAGRPISAPVTRGGLGTTANAVPNGRMAFPNQSSFTGRPAPIGGHEFRAANGSMVLNRPNGTRSDFHDAGRGLEVHHNLDGNRHIFVERADHSRVFAERGGRGYVQHPYSYNGREFAHRTYYDHGRAYDNYYHRYGYRGQYLDVYAPARYYPAGFYGWAYNPWASPIRYSWGWNSAAWYGAYGSYFAPEPVYPSASFWLTDYLIGNSLQAAYAEESANNQEAANFAGGAPPPPGESPVMTPEIKTMIAAEVQRQVALENYEAQANAQKQDIDPASSSIARLLSDDQVHVFVVNSDLDLVTSPDGTECPVSAGDVLKIAEPPAPDATSAYAVILSSKGWRNECHSATAVSVAFTDLQEMQNHMRETIDAGMGDLRTKQGQGGIPAAPPAARLAPVASTFAAIAPPPDPNAASEINQQTVAANQAEQEVAGVAPPSGPSDQQASAPASNQAATVTISIGQTISEVRGTLGAPAQVLGHGVKIVYVYPDMKITFKDGKVYTVE